jgi:hypothetical protein
LELKFGLAQSPTLLQVPQAMATHTAPWTAKVSVQAAFFLVLSPSANP